MATGTNAIATRQEAYAKYQSGGTMGLGSSTKYGEGSRLIDAGLLRSGIDSGYSWTKSNLYPDDNQCVKYSDIIVEQDTVSKYVHLFGIYANGNGKVSSQSRQSSFGGVFHSDDADEFYFTAGSSGYFGSNYYQTIWESDSNTELIEFEGSDNSSRSVRSYKPADGLNVLWGGGDAQFSYITWELRAGNAPTSTNTFIASGRLDYMYGGLYICQNPDQESFYLTYQYNYYNLYFLAN